MEKVIIAGPGELKMNRHRISVNQHGALLGNLIFGVDVKTLDPEYRKKKELSDVLVPHVPIKIYSLERILVKKVAMDEDADGNVVVIFNDDSKLRFPVTNPELREPNIATLKEAIAAKENGGTPIFFEDCEKLTQEITALNKVNYNKLVRMTKDLAAQAEGLMSAMELDARQCEDYLSSRRTDMDVKITVAE